MFDSVGGLGWVQVGGTSVGAPSWSGLIAIADQGLALAGKGSLANAQDDLYQLPSSDFNDITSGSTPFHSAGPGYDLVTGLGSPKANLLIPALVAADGGSSAVTKATTAQSAVSISASPHDVTITTAPSPATVSASATAASSSAGSTASIAPLTPAVLADSNSRAPIVVTVVLPATIANLGPSAAPATAQATLAVVANLQGPTTPTDFGQSAAAVPGARGPQEQVAVPSNEAEAIDVVEPFQPAAPEAEVQPGLPPSAAPTGLLPAFAAPNFETLVDRSVADLYPEPLFSASRLGDQPEEIRSSLGLSTVFGAAIVAAGGYHLALRPFDRFRRRSTPAETEADRSANGRLD